VQVKIFHLTVHGCCKETFQSIAMNICTVHCRMLRNLVHVKNQQLQECIYSTLYNKIVVQTVVDVMTIVLYCWCMVPTCRDTDASLHSAAEADSSTVASSRTPCLEPSRNASPSWICRYR